VLVPLPTSADDHQRQNALEFVEIGASTLCEQGSGDLAAAIREWTGDEAKRQAAQKALAEWDIPDATARLATIIEEAARKHA
jgi:UDP-N-acetylglucosamine:LPS N-acetylglucosamine transferase